MDTEQMILQIVMGAIGALSFSVWFNVRGWSLFFGCLGGIISWVVYLITGGQPNNDLLNYLYAAMAATLYSEVLARILKRPVTVFLISSLVPLLPGGLLYYTMASCLRGDFQDFSSRGFYTISITAMMALGIMTVMMFMKLYYAIKARMKLIGR